jgi:class 3 adenylate cyclase
MDPGSPLRSASPETYTPKPLAEKILTSKSALEGERKQVTVLFPDLKGSMEMLADRDPEEVRRLLEPVLESMIEAVHRYEGTVNQVMGDGIMVLLRRTARTRGPRRAGLLRRAPHARDGEAARRGGSPSGGPAPGATRLALHSSLSSGASPR